MSAGPSNLGGAYDLSGLVNRARNQSGASTNGSQRNTPDTGATGTPIGATAGGQASTQVEVAALVSEVQPAELANFVKLSERVPVIVEFHTVRAPSSQELGRKLSSEVVKRNGDVLMVCIDADHPKVGTLLQAFQVQSLPAVAVLLMGQPVPLFNGDQEADVLKQVVDRVILLARENGVSDRAVVSESAPAAAEPALPPRHKAAYDAIEAGDYATAVSEFQAALNEAPADSIADAGLAQAKLLLRTDGLDLQQVLENPTSALPDVLQKADVLAVIGQFDKAFDAILLAFAVADKEDRDALRPHLLELFKVAGSENPEVTKARLRLTSLLY